MFRRGEALLGKLTQRDPSLRFVARDEHLDQMLVLGPGVRRRYSRSAAGRMRASWPRSAVNCRPKQVSNFLLPRCNPLPPRKSQRSPNSLKWSVGPLGFEPRTNGL